MGGQRVDIIRYAGNTARGARLLSSLQNVCGQSGCHDHTLHWTHSRRSQYGWLRDVIGPQKPWLFTNNVLSMPSSAFGNEAITSAAQNGL